jgi:CubicO group peptidase (beta-lactamase class C family)
MTFRAVGRMLVLSGTVCFAVDSSVIDRYIRAEIERNDIPGASVAISRNGEIIYAAGFGVRSVVTGDLMTADTPVDLASVSKPLTAFAVKQLSLQRSVNSDAPVTRYLPELGQAFTSVRIRDLIRHASGLTRRDDILVLCCGRPGEYDLDVAVQALAAAEPAKSRGSFVYANSNYVLMAAVIQRVSGRPFPVFMAESVFRPLRMRQTTLDPEEARRWGLAEPHERCWRAGLPGRELFLGWYGSSLVKSTASDMARFLESAYSGRARSWSEPYDEGWFIRRLRQWPGNPIVLEHGGNTEGGNTAVIAVPAWRMAAVVLLNSGTHRAAEIARAVLLGSVEGRLPRAAKAGDGCGPK